MRDHGQHCVGPSRWTSLAAASSLGVTALAAAAIVGSLVVSVYAGGVDWRELLLSTRWDPIRGSFGALAMMWGTVAVSVVALLLGAPVGWLAAIAINELAPRRFRSWARGATEVLAAVPSIVYGLLGVAFVRPFVASLANVPSGDSLLAGGLVLAVMILPTITAVSVDALASVPLSVRESASAIGLMKLEVIREAVVPRAWPGLRAGALLGLSRALGETVAVFLLIGRADGRMPRSPGDALSQLVRPGQTLTSKLNGPEPLLAGNSGPHWAALCALGVLLLLAVAGLTFVGLRALGRGSEENAHRERRSWLRPKVRARSVREAMSRLLVTGALLFPILLATVILATVATKGQVAVHPQFWAQPAVGAAGGGVRNEIAGTVLLVATTGAITAPVGLGLGLIMSAFGSTRSRRLLRAGVLSLGAVPSIVLGLIGYHVLCTALGWGKSWLAGALLLAVLAVPVVAIAVGAAVDAIPRERLEAAKALGLRRGQLLRSVLIPHAHPGLITGLLLGLARAAGETAPLLFTATVFAGAPVLPAGIREAPVQALPTRIFALAQDSADPASLSAAWGAATVLLCIAAVLALAAVPVRRRLATRP